MALLMIGVFKGEKSLGVVSLGAIVTFAIAIVLIINGASDGKTFAFGGALVFDGFAVFTKLLIVVGALVALVMSLGYIQSENIGKFEFPILVLLATLGMMVMVSANDLLTLYMGLELQSLSLYVLAAFKRGSLRSTEAGLKYFVLGALSSGMLLYGCSLIYGFTGTTNFVQIAEVTQGNLTTGSQIGVIFGLTFLIAGLAFKISAVPFHMWTPDVYEGAPTPVTAFFAAAPKIAAMALFIRVTMGAFAPAEGATAPWQQVLVFLAMASMVLGAFAAIGQTNIKRLMAYSSIGHMGFAMVGLASGSQAGVKAVLIYLFIYMITTIGAFACILSMRRKEGMVENISDLSGLSQTNKVLAALLSLIMFSLAGIPPLAGFFAKFYVFVAAIDAGLVWLAIIGVLSSVVSAFYYIRIIKIIYFDDPAPAFERAPFEIRTLSMVAGLFTLLFVVIVRVPLNWVETAAGSLF